MIEENWAAGWIYGLVPPKTVNAAARCPQGVAKVMTQHSFANQLVAGLTFGIYTPMTIQVTCAQISETSSLDKENTLTVSKYSTEEELRRVFQLAAEKSIRSKKEIFIVIEDPNTPTRIGS